MKYIKIAIILIIALFVLSNGFAMPNLSWGDNTTYYFPNSTFNPDTVFPYDYSTQTGYVVSNLQVLLPNTTDATGRWRTYLAGSWVVSPNYNVSASSQSGGAGTQFIILPFINTNVSKTTTNKLFLDYQHGDIYYDSTNAGNTCYFYFRGMGTLIRPEPFNVLMKEIQHVEQTFSSGSVNATDSTKIQKYGNDAAFGIITFSGKSTIFTSDVLMRVTTQYGTQDGFDFFYDVLTGAALYITSSSSQTVVDIHSYGGGLGLGVNGGAKIAGEFSVIGNATVTGTIYGQATGANITPQGQNNFIIAPTLTPLPSIITTQWGKKDGNISEGYEIWVSDGNGGGYFDFFGDGGRADLKFKTGYGTATDSLHATNANNALTLANKVPLQLNVSGAVTATYALNQPTTFPSVSVVTDNIIVLNNTGFVVTTTNSGFSEWSTAATGVYNFDTVINYATSTTTTHNGVLFNVSTSNTNFPSATIDIYVKATSANVSRIYFDMGTALIYNGNLGSNYTYFTSASYEAGDGLDYDSTSFNSGISFQTSGFMRFLSSATSKIKSVSLNGDGAGFWFHFHVEAETFTTLPSFDAVSVYYQTGGSFTYTTTLAYTSSNYVVSSVLNTTGTASINNLVVNGNVSGLTTLSNFSSTLISVTRATVGQLIASIPNQESIFFKSSSGGSGSVASNASNVMTFLSHTGMEFYYSDSLLGIALGTNGKTSTLSIFNQGIIESTTLNIFGTGTANNFVVTGTLTATLPASDVPSTFTTNYHMVTTLIVQGSETTDKLVGLTSVTAPTVSGATANSDTFIFSFSGTTIRNDQYGYATVQNTTGQTTITFSPAFTIRPLFSYAPITSVSGVDYRIKVVSVDTARAVLSFIKYTVVSAIPNNYIHDNGTALYGQDDNLGLGNWVLISNNYQYDIPATVSVSSVDASEKLSFSWEAKGK